MQQGTLLYCDHCKTNGKAQVLGRMLSGGELLVLRYHLGTTLLKSDAYTLSCGCGFTYYIVGSDVQGTYMLGGQV